MPKVQGTTIATAAQKLTPPHTVLKMKQKKRNSSSSAILQTFVSKIVMLFMISRYFLRLFDCLAHPSLGAPLATDQK